MSDQAGFLSIYQSSHQDVLVGGIQFLERLAHEAAAFGFFDRIGGEAGRGFLIDGLLARIVRTQPVLGGVAGNAVDEGRKLGGLTELTVAQGAQHADEDVVQEIPGSFAVAGASAQHGEDAGTEQQDELVLGLGITRKDALGQTRLSFFAEVLHAELKGQFIIERKNRLSHFDASLDRMETNIVS